ncbi:MAG: hypothetical protein U0Z75_04170 [Deinococcaceae bacterium]
MSSISSHSGPLEALLNIIVHPTLWAAHLNQTREGGTDALSNLQVQLSKIDGPVARARECQVLLILQQREAASALVQFEQHPLCRAMYMATLLERLTYDAYLEIVGQPEILIQNYSNVLDREAQMRWDFIRAQTFQQLGDMGEALRLYGLAHRVAAEFEISTILRVCTSQLKALAPISTEAKRSATQIKVDGLTQEIKNAKMVGDFAAVNAICYQLCVLHLRDDDYASFRRAIEQKHNPGQTWNAMTLVTEFFLGRTPSVSVNSLKDLTNGVFEVTAYLLWKFHRLKWHMYSFRDRRGLAKRLALLTDCELPDNMDLPILHVIMLTVKLMAFVFAKDMASARKCLISVRGVVKKVSDLPKEGWYYLSFCEAYLSYSKDREIREDLRYTLIESIEKSQSFRNFVIQCAPELVFFINSEKREPVLQEILERVLVITKNGCFLGKTQVRGFPKTEMLIEAIDLWDEGAPMDAYHYKSLSRYAEHLETVSCKGVIVSWHVLKSMQSDGPSYLNFP